MIENPLLLWAIVGSASGAILGLAGTGGGVISIPLLMTLGGYDVKTASAYGLLSLSVGAALNWVFHRQNTLYPVTAVLIVVAGVIAYLTVPLKTMTPEWIVILLLNLTCLFSLYSLWILRRPDDQGEERSLVYRLRTSAIGGVLTGVLSTMTGLGGGVVIIPWLTGITRLSFSQALACSLLTISIIAPLSAWRQLDINLTPGAWLSLIGGVCLTSFLVKKGIAYIPVGRMTVIHKLSLTGVICYSMGRTLWALF